MRGCIPSRPWHRAVRVGRVRVLVTCTPLRSIIDDTWTLRDQVGRVPGVGNGEHAVFIHWRGIQWVVFVCWLPRPRLWSGTRAAIVMRHH